MFIDNAATEYVFDDDGQGNLRIYSLVAGVRTYFNSQAGTVDYENGIIKINSILITSVSNVDGSASTQFRLTVLPDSNDVIGLRDLYIKYDMTNTELTVVQDIIASGENTSATAYVKTSSYASETIYTR